MVTLRKFKKIIKGHMNKVLNNQFTKFKSKDLKAWIDGNWSIYTPYPAQSAKNPKDTPFKFMSSFAPYGVIIHGRARRQLINHRKRIKCIK